MLKAAMPIFAMVLGISLLGCGTETALLDGAEDEESATQPQLNSNGRAGKRSRVEELYPELLAGASKLSGLTAIFSDTGETAVRPNVKVPTAGEPEETKYTYSEATRNPIYPKDGGEYTPEGSGTPTRSTPKTLALQSEGVTSPCIDATSERVKHHDASLAASNPACDAAILALVLLRVNIERDGVEEIVDSGRYFNHRLESMVHRVADPNFFFINTHAVVSEVCAKLEGNSLCRNFIPSPLVHEAGEKLLRFWLSLVTEDPATLTQLLNDLDDVIKSLISQYDISQLLEELKKQQ